MQQKTLKTTLYINAVSSGLLGLGMAVAPGPITGLLGNFPPVITLIVGLGLIPFAIAVGVVARKLPASRSHVSWIFYADAAWVIATPIALAAFAGYLTLLGKVALIGIGLVVAYFAVIEWRGTRRHHAAV